jgi:hypothetical protein
MSPSDLLPDYVNGALTESDTRAVEAWLDADPAARAQLAAWQAVRASVVTQPLRPPSPAVRERLLARARQTPTPYPLAQAAGWAAVILLALWMVIQPGLGLRWVVALNGDPLTAFRIYRAPAGTQAFELIAEIPAQAAVTEYEYVDMRSLPVGVYQYRVEGLGPNTRPVLSETVAVSAAQVWPSLAAMLLVSGLAGVALARVMPAPRLRAKPI